jgi:murein L,D-transpeptidase YafK
MLRTFAFIVGAFAMLTASALHCEAAVTATADHVVILKSKRMLFLLAGDHVLRSYRIALGQVPGAKREQGDKKTPEGRYFISGRNPNSRFHLSLQLSYPNDMDLARAQAAGRPPGGDIFIHGMPVDDTDGDPAIFYADWTDGCIAVSNRAIEEMWDLVPDGTPVDIFGRRLARKVSMAQTARP